MKIKPKNIIYTPTDINSSIVAIALPIEKFVQALTLSGLENQIFSNNFKRKEDKYFATIVNDTQVQNGEIFWGNQTAGVKGFFATVKMKLDKSVTGKKELFAVSTNFVESSY